MVEPGARETKITGSASSSAGSDAGVMKKKKKKTTTKLVVAGRKVDEKDKKQLDYKCRSSSGGDEWCKVESRHQCTEPESPSYRLALRSLFSCRNSSHAGHHRAPDCKKLGCNSAASICKVKQDNLMHTRRPEEELKVKDKPPLAEPYCKRRASVSACNISSERSVKKSVKQQEAQASSCLLSSASASSSSSTAGGGGGSFRGMQQLSLRRLSGCYECHMVVDPISGVFRDSSSMRATICSCPDCGEIFVRPDSLHLHQAIRHAGHYTAKLNCILHALCTRVMVWCALSFPDYHDEMRSTSIYPCKLLHKSSCGGPVVPGVSELGAEDTSRNIISIIFQSSWLKKQSPVCAIDRILKVHNAARTLARFDDYRDAVKAKAHRHLHPRCTADGNELLRFHCATLSCDLGLHGATHLCDHHSCAACSVIRHGFRPPTPGAGIRTMATSGRAHDAVVSEGDRRAMLVCRVIAGRVRREEPAAPEDEYDSVAGTAPGLYSNLDDLDVFNPTAILPCFVVVYRA
uniref:C2H2-type domain-containing protein n=1 Tax=Oryza punctata TaxID=4537 RepID=A0A0E0KX68_ORYPU